MSKHTVSTESGAMGAGGHKAHRAALRALAGASALSIPTVSSIAAAQADPILPAIEGVVWLTAVFTKRSGDHSTALSVGKSASRATCFQACSSRSCASNSAFMRSFASRPRARRKGGLSAWTASMMAFVARAGSPA
jgi:hypothetical protein